VPDADPDAEEHILKRAGLLALLPFALTGCGLLDATGPDAGPLLRTDSVRYVLQLVPSGSAALTWGRANIGYTFTNRTGHDVQAEGCRRPDAPLIEKRTGDSWTVVWGGAYLLCWSEPLPIGEGESYSGTFEVIVPLSGPYADPQWQPASPDDRYRLRWDSVTPVSDVQRTSNEFAIVASWLVNQPPAESRF